MGILTSLLVVFVVAVIWGAVPGVAADPFQIPAELAAIMPGFGDGVVRPESQYTVILPQAVDNVRSFVSDMSAAAQRTPPSFDNTVCPQDLQLPQQDRQYIYDTPSTAGSFRSPPSSSAPAGYTPLEPRRQVAVPSDNYGLSEATLHQHDASSQGLSSHNNIPSWGSAVYHPGDGLVRGRVPEDEREQLSVSVNRRCPKIENGYHCSHCPKSYSRKRDLNLHARTHNPQQACTMCSRRFVSRREVKRHVDSVHHGERRFGCEQCTSTFARKDNLDRHVTTVHRGHSRSSGGQDLAPIVHY